VLSPKKEKFVQVNQKENPFLFGVKHFFFRERKRAQSGEDPRFESGRAHFKLFFKKENLDQKKRNFRGLGERCCIPKNYLGLIRA